MEDLTNKVTLSKLRADEFVQPMAEIQKVITESGLALTSADVNQLYKALPATVKTKAEALALELVDGKKIFITSSDGGKFTMRTGAPIGTYNDNGGTFTGTQFTSGDGSSGIQRDFNGELNTIWFGSSIFNPDNYTAFQNAIDTNFPIIRIDPGTFFYGTTLTIDRAIIFTGSGSCQDNGQPGVSTTQLVYQGSNVGIDLVGSGANGKENIHLSDFSLYGTIAALGGIDAGTTGFIQKSTFKNVHIASFTRAQAFGIKLRKILTSTFENFYTQNNFDGILNSAGDVATTLTFVSVYSRSNSNIGVRFSGDMSGIKFGLLVIESNAYEGLLFHGASIRGINIFTLYDENNCTTGGVSAVTLTGAALSKCHHINIYGWDSIASNYSNIYTPGNTLTSPIIRHLKLDYAEHISIYNPRFSFYKLGHGGQVIDEFMEVTANSNNISLVMTDQDVTQSNITGYYLATDVSINGVVVGKGTVAATASTSGTITLSPDDDITWSKIGTLITVRGTIIINALSAPVGFIRITGLPYILGDTPIAGLEYGGSFPIYIYSLAAGAVTSIVGRFEGGSSNIIIGKYAAGVVTNLDSVLQVGTVIEFSVTYHSG